MRILLVSNYQPPHMGGIEFAAGALKQCWEEDGHQVTWMTTDIPRGTRPNTPENIRVRSANFLETWWQVNSPVIHPLAYPEIVRQVRSHDVINIHSLAPGLSTLTLWAALRRQRPAVATQHVGVIPMRAGLLNLAQKVFLCRTAAWAVSRGTLLTFVGEAVRDWVVQQTGIPTDRVTMTPAGIDQRSYFFVADDERSKLRDRWDLARHRFNVLFVGRFYEKKGLPLMETVARQCPDIHFTFVGSGPVDPTEWHLPNVRVIPFVSTSELREIYGSHDLFIMPSVGEGWPAVVPQAMACGLACLVSEATFAGYNRDPDRFVIAPRDPEKLAGILKQAASNGLPLLNRRSLLSEYALQTWDWKKTARIYLDLFRQVMAEHP